MAAILSIVIVLLEVFFPWASKDGVNPELPTLPSFSSAVPSVVEAWNSAGPPILSGVVIGSLQIPAVLFLGDTLGSSSAYMFLVSQVLVVPSMQNYFKHLDGFRRGVDNLWQVLYLGTAFGGSFLASKVRQGCARSRSCLPVRMYELAGSVGPIFFLWNFACKIRIACVCMSDVLQRCGSLFLCNVHEADCPVSIRSSWVSMALPRALTLASQFWEGF